MKLKENIPVMCTSDFWYDIFDGGYITPKMFLEDQADIEAVENAMAIVDEFRHTINPLIEEM